MGDTFPPSFLMGKVDRVYCSRSSTRATRVGPTVQVGQARMKVPVGPTKLRLARPARLAS
eukprot:5851373-Amphidinium_carterae.1